MVKLIVNRVLNQPWHRRMNRVVVCDSELDFRCSSTDGILEAAVLRHLAPAFLLGHLALVLASGPIRTADCSRCLQHLC
jgi:hypothetical protein